MAATRPHPARPIALLILGIGLVSILISVVYSLANMGNSFLGFDTRQMLIMGIVFVVVGLILLLFLLKPEESTPVENPEIPKLKRRMDEGFTRIDSLQGQADAIKNDLYGEPVLAEDLQILEGVGPQIANALIDDGLDSFKKIAHASVGDIRRALDKKGIGFAPSMQTWPGQAEWVDKGDVIAFEQLTQHLKAGMADMVTVEELEIIEGIGPKIALALLDAKIDSFEKLSNASEERLRAVLKEADISFAPSLQSWAKQAAYIVQGDTVGFRRYKAQLNAGREDDGA